MKAIYSSRWKHLRNESVLSAIKKTFVFVVISSLLILTSWACFGYAGVTIALIGSAYTYRRIKPMKDENSFVIAYPSNPNVDCFEVTSETCISEADLNTVRADLETVKTGVLDRIMNADGTDQQIQVICRIPQAGSVAPRTKHFVIGAGIDNEGLRAPFSKILGMIGVDNRE